MSYRVKRFSGAFDLCEWLNDNKIKKEDVVAVLPYNMSIDLNCIYFDRKDDAANDFVNGQLAICIDSKSELDRFVETLKKCGYGRFVEENGLMKNTNTYDHNAPIYAFVNKKVGSYTFHTDINMKLMPFTTFDNL